MIDHYDVVIVGAGIVGLSTALYLRRAGLGVAVVERGAIGHAASGNAAGMVSPFAEVDGPPALDKLALEAVTCHRQLAAELMSKTGIDVQFEPLSVLVPAFDEAELSDLRARLTRQGNAFGLRLLTSHEARALEPRLTPETIAALLAPGEAQVDSYRLTLAIGQCAEREGAVIRHGRVTGLLNRGRRVEGVRLPGERILADRVILAGGPWTGQMAKWLGIPVPVVPLRGQLLRLRVPAPPFQCCIFHKGGYLLRKGDGLTIAGTTEELVGFRARTTRAAETKITRSALRLAPSIQDAELILQTACLRPRSLDDLPILGPVPGWKGVYLAAGHGRRGILLGPITGQLIAKMVLGQPVREDLRLFSPDRFTTASESTLRLERTTIGAI